MDTIQDRIEQVITALDITDREFALRSQISPSTLSNVLGGRRSNPSVEVLQKIKSAYPELNLNWLVSGNGEMWKDYQEKNGSEILNQKNEIIQDKQFINNDLDNNSSSSNSNSTTQKTQELNQQKQVNSIHSVSINYHSGEVHIHYNK